MSVAEFFESEAVSVIFPIVTFVAGFLTSRFTMSKSDRKAFEQTIYENTRFHKKQKEERCAEFQKVLRSYIEGESAPSIDTFYDIATKGDLYFGELRAIADAILAKKVDRSSRDNTFVPDILDALRKSIPAYYKNLQKLSKKIGANYSGHFTEDNYKSMFCVAKKYGDMRDDEIRRLTAANTSSTLG